jgi:hypothetical protein
VTEICFFLCRVFLVEFLHTFLTDLLESEDLLLQIDPVIKVLIESHPIPDKDTARGMEQLVSCSSFDLALAVLISCWLLWQG